MAGRGRGKRVDGTAVAAAAPRTGQAASASPPNNDLVSQIESMAVVDKTVCYSRERHDSGVAAGSTSGTSSMTNSMHNEVLPRVEVAAKVAPGNLGIAVQISSQSYWLHQKEDYAVFRYEVQTNEILNDKKKTAKEVTRGAKTDYVYTKRRELSYWVFITVANREKAAFGDFYELTYDRRRILYSVHKLKLGAKNKMDFEVSMNELVLCYKSCYDSPNTNESHVRAQFEVHPAVTGFKVSVQVAEGADQQFELRPKQLQSKTSLDVAQRDRSLEQYYELATSQNIFFYDNFLCYYGRNFYSQGQRQPLKTWAELGVGIQKSVRVVEGDKSTCKPCVVMQLDVKKSAFFKAMPVMDHLVAVLNLKVSPDRWHELKFNPNQIEHASKMIHDLAVRYTEPNTGATRTIEAVGFSAKSAENTQFTMTHEGHTFQITVFQYYLKKYNYRLKCANAPCVMTRSPKGASFYPAELCRIQPNQRVVIGKPAKLADEMIRACALDPFTRHKELAQLSREARVFMSNGQEQQYNMFLPKLGIQLESHALTLDGRVLPQPTVMYANGPMQTQRDGGWKLNGRKFVRGAALVKWAIALAGENIIAMPQANAFLASYMDMASSLGLKNVKTPTKQKCEDSPAGVKLLMEKMKELGVRFVLFLTADQSNLHDVIKLSEQSTGVVTQHVLVGTVFKSTKGPMTFQNILMKTNMKLGGLNHDLDYSALNIENRAEWESHNRLFMGLDVNHPPPMDRNMRRKGFVEKQPSVIGFCSNAGRHSLDFVGDYEYCATREEIAQSVHSQGLKRQATQSLQAYKASNKKYPSEIWMYRDGVSEGQYQQVLDFEVAQLRAAIEDTLPRGVAVPKLVYMIVTKRHNTRLVPMMAALEQLQQRQRNGERINAPMKNIQSGTVIDTNIVSAKYKEFYLNSHKTIQGTARTPKYTVLLDECSHSMNTLETVSHKLCFAHGIVTSAVSIPAPCYAAHNLAKRGKQNFLAHMASDESRSSGISSGSGDFEQETEQPLNIDVLNEQLKYNGTALGNVNFWA